MSNTRLSHLDARGQARMVDVGAKGETDREAVARGFVTLRPDTLRLIRNQALPKGDVYATARLAGILAAKRVHELVPLCHPLLITAAEVAFRATRRPSGIEIESRVKTTGRTGAEMEALTAVSVAALTIYDMCKAVDKGMMIGDVRLVYKAGGRSGMYRRPGEAPPTVGA
ncbi:MAG: cyclic pyranopterin monophosphate synthase MoaC [candidate division NC10 bacterium]|nr:cyclic pyranopterin monophosphate synthase MoaC [candidate division NC10 bacterium]